MNGVCCPKYQSTYTIPQGAPVRVCDSTGLLHEHKLKNIQFFHDCDRAYASMENLAFRPGETDVLGLAELESQGFIIFKTGCEKWPYIVAAYQ